MLSSPITAVPRKNFIFQNFTNTFKLSFTFAKYAGYWPLEFRKSAVKSKTAGANNNNVDSENEKTSGPGQCLETLDFSHLSLSSIILWVHIFLTTLSYAVAEVLNHDLFHGVIRPDEPDFIAQNHPMEMTNFRFAVGMACIGALCIRLITIVSGPKIIQFWKMFEGIFEDILNLDLETETIISSSGNENQNQSSKDSTSSTSRHMAQARRQDQENLIKKMFCNLQSRALILTVIVTGIAMVESCVSSYLATEFLFNEFPSYVATLVLIMLVYLRIQAAIHSQFYVVLFVIIKSVSTAFQILALKIEALCEISLAQEAQNKLKQLQDKKSKRKIFSGCKCNPNQQVNDSDNERENDLGLENEKNNTENVFKILKLSYEVSELFKTFNDLFKIQIIFILWFAGFPLMYNLYLCCKYIMNGWISEPGLLGGTIFGLLVLFLVRNFVVLCFICNAGGTVTNGALDFGNTLGKFWLEKSTAQNGPNNSPFALCITQISTQPMELCPGGFLTFNNGFITSFLAAVVTYVVIIIQFTSTTSGEISVLPEYSCNCSGSGDLIGDLLM